MKCGMELKEGYPRRAMMLDEVRLARSGIVELTGSVPRGRGHKESTSDKESWK